MPRLWLSIAVVSAISLSIAWASTDPPSSSSSNTSGVPASYTATIHITGPTTSFHDSVAARYNYAFGKDAPFLPSNAMTVNGQFLSPKAFYTAEYCGHCHKEAYHQWRQSVHSNSFRAPWYLKNVEPPHRRKGRPVLPPLRRFHNPVALFSGDLSQGVPKKATLRGRGRHLLHLPLDPVH